MIDFSIGFLINYDFTEREWNGKEYDHIERDIEIIHNARMVTQEPACSIEDGCGYIMNEEGEDKMSDEDKKPKAEEGKNLKPSAAWIVAEDGEHLLVLNQVAAAMQIALLDQLMEVITELQKLSPKSGKKNV